jgi:hypothetical protein
MPPQILYRYRSLAGDAFKHTQDIFLRNRLYMPLASSMNDPGEGMCGLELPGPPLPPTATEAEKWGRGNQGWGLRIRHSEALQRFRLASFSSSCTNSLLWAHYADSHRGICIGFLVVASPVLATAVEVAYEDVPPVWQGDNDDLARRVFCTKWSHWSYEQEWRIVSTDSYVDLPAGAIDTVIFGARTSEEDQEWVRDWLAMTRSAASLKRAVLPQTGYDKMTIQSSR